MKKAKGAPQDIPEGVSSAQSGHDDLNLHDFDFDAEFSDLTADKASTHSDDSGFSLDSSAPGERVSGQAAAAVDAPVLKKSSSKKTSAKKDVLTSQGSGGFVSMIKENWIYIVGGGIALGIASYIIYGIFESAAPNVPQRVAPVVHAQNFGALDQVQPEKTLTAVNAPSHLAKSTLNAPVSGQVAVQLPTQSTAMIAPNASGTASPEMAMPASVRAPTEIATKQVSSDGLKSSSVNPAVQPTPAPMTSVTQVSSIDAKLTNIQNFLSQSVEGQLTYQTQAQAAQAAMNARISALQSQVTALTQQLQTQSATMTEMSKTLALTQKSLSLILAQKMQDVQQYTLRAVVPGQAWLVNKSGQTVTLSVGSELKDYGHVVSIDTTNGTVTMSSGYVFS